MTPEQKQLRIEQILEHQKRRSYALFQNGRSPMSDDTYAETDFLLSLVKSQEAGGDLQSRDDVLKFFGASLKENGDLSIDMKKYHAAHLCQEHSFQPWRRNEIEDKCVMCLARDRENAATEMRSAFVEKLREYLTDCREEERGIIEAIAGELETFSTEKPKEQE